MDELATAPALADYSSSIGFTRCAVHQQTQRIFAVVGARYSNAVILLDANLQVVATVEAAKTVGYELTIRDVAVHGDQMIVLTSDSHPKGSGLRLLDLDGRFLRTIAAGQLRNPQVVAASHGRAFVVDQDEDDIDEDYDENDEDKVEPGMVLHVIDIQSGDILQSVPLELALSYESTAYTIIVDRDEIYIADYTADKVVVLRFAGSEA
eukprot:scaffold17007_cov91-Phaeocystis_antarctica.AAC.1